MYKKELDLDRNVSNTCIRRISDQAVIPFDPANTSYREYLEWLAEGNIPEEAE